MWSSSNLASYLAVTAHWISRDESNGRLSIKAALIGFRRVTARHTGANIAKAILEVLDQAKVTLKVFFIAISIYLHAKVILDRPFHTGQC